jgi:hypothetical protein
MNYRCGLMEDRVVVVKVYLYEKKHKLLLKNPIKKSRASAFIKFD